MSKQQNKFITAIEYNGDNIIFGDPKSESNGFRTPVKYRYDDGTEGAFIFLTEKCYSFGISDPPKKKDQQEKKDDRPRGHIMTLCLWNGKDKKGPTAAQTAQRDMIHDIHERGESFLNTDTTRKLFKIPKTSKNQVQLKYPIYMKPDPNTMEPMEDASPQFSPKVREFFQKDGKGQPKITTLFTDQLHEPIKDPMAELFGVHCEVRCAVQLESIYYNGSNNALQFKLYHVIVYNKRDFTNVKPIIPMEPELPEMDDASRKMEDLNMDDDIGSLNGDDAPKKSPTKALQKKKVVRSIKAK